jgi:hypothetical protein
MSRDEIRSGFADGRRVDAIEAATSENHLIVDGAPA